MSIDCHTLLTPELIQELKEKNAVVALIDADIPSYSVAFRCEREVSWSLVERTLDNWMRDKISKVEATHYLGFLTNGGKNYRIKDAVTRPYKGNRAGSERPKWYGKLREYMQTGWKCQVMQGIEADDALTIVQQYLMDHGIKSIICSLDKDLRQQPGWHYNWDSGVLDYIDYDKGELNLWKQVITGDLGTDNIPGLSEFGWSPKIGSKVPVFESYMKVPNETKMLASGKPSSRKMAHAKFSHWETLDDIKQCKPLKDHTYGPTRAAEMLEGVAVEDYPAVVLKGYVDFHWVDGEIEGLEDPAEFGIRRFNEVFRLIYMLRYIHEIPNEAVIDFRPHEVGHIEFNEFEDDGDDLADFNDDF